MSRNLAITAGDGQTGHLIAELILTNNDFAKKVNSVTITALHPDSELAQDLKGKGAKIVAMTAGDKGAIVKALKDANIDTICLIPPATSNKVELTKEMLEAAKEADVKNVLFLSAAGCDMADEKKQPHLREFIHLEAMVLATKGDVSVDTGHSPCVIRAGFYAENLLLYNKQAQSTGKFPLPAGDTHKFAPVALGDIAQLAAHVLTGEGPHGFNDTHRGQLMVLTGPMLASGDELAAAASEALGVKMQYENISEEEAKTILDTHSTIDDSEKEFLLEYYSLVREGKTNYISTHAFHDVTGNHPMELTDFFKAYSGEFKPKKRKTSK